MVPIFGVHHVQVGVQAPADRLCRTVEVPPSGVGFCAARHPDIGKTFQPMDDALRKAFLPALFQGGTS